MDNIPWSDCKIAFPVQDVKKIWENINKYNLPNGWKLNETDCSGARCVAVFRIEGVPTRQDGLKVKQILRLIDKEV